MSACRSCRAPIFWALSSAGKAMPIDADPTDGGNVTIEHDRKARGLRATVHGDPSTIPADDDRYTSHFVTCPDAKGHRKGGE